MRKLSKLDIASELTALLIKFFDLDESTTLSKDLEKVYITVALSMKFLNFRFCSQDRNYSKREYKVMLSTIKNTFEMLAKESILASQQKIKGKLEKENSHGKK